MSLVLPPAPGAYSKENEQQTRNLIVSADAQNLKSTLIEDGDLLANIAGRPAQPVGESLTQYLDYVFGTLYGTPASILQGAIIYRDSTGNGGWLALPPGLIHQVLETQGPKQNPQWQGLSTVLDETFGSAQGSVLYRDGDAWKVLAPGSSGDVLTTEGPGANPQWTAAGAPVSGANPTA